MANANFATDGIDLAVRNMPLNPPSEPSLEFQKMTDLTYIPVCTPRVLEKHGPVNDAQSLARVPLIHDESLTARGAAPSWSEWFRAAGIDNVDLKRGLHFTSADHALDAAEEDAGVLLTHDIMAYDGLRTGRLVIPVKLSIAAGRTFQVVRLRGRRPTPAMNAFAKWIKDEVAALDWRPFKTKVMRL
jgi:LysR family glycine cleavage system transcriptional activator